MNLSWFKNILNFQPPSSSPRQNAADLEQLLAGVLVLCSLSKNKKVRMNWIHARRNIQFSVCRLSRIFVYQPRAARWASGKASNLLLCCSMRRRPSESWPGCGALQQSGKLAACCDRYLSMKPVTWWSTSWFIDIVFQMHRMNKICQSLYFHEPLCVAQNMNTAKSFSQMWLKGFQSHEGFYFS